MRKSDILSKSQGHANLLPGFSRSGTLVEDGLRVTQLLWKFIQFYKKILQETTRSFTRN